MIIRINVLDNRSNRGGCEMINFNRSVCGWAILLAGMLVVSASLLAKPAMAIPQDEGVVWYTDLEEAKKKSRISGMPILVKFEADWCQPCQLLSKELKKTQLVRTLEQVVPVVINIDKQEDLATRFDVSSIPKVILIDDAETVLADKTGFAPVGDWKTWIEESLEDTEFSMPEELASFDPPTTTEVEELILRLNAKDAAMRELAMERLVSFPAKTRKHVVGVLRAVKNPKTKKKKKKISLSQQLAVLEVLKRWGAPTDGIDPWTPDSFTEERLKGIQIWTDTPIEELSGGMAELSEADLEQASAEIDLLLAGRSVKAGLSRLTRYGQGLLPQVYERIKVAKSDEEVTRLTALRYWLTASNQLRLGWAGGLIELAGRDAETRRAAAAVLVKRAGELDQALLMELFADSDPLVRELALKGLNGLGSEDTEKAMVRLLKDPDPNVRAAVLKQFAESETKSAVDAVAEYLETETDSGLVVQAIRFMREVGGSTAVEAIVPFTEHESWQVRAELAESLGKIDEDDLTSKVKTTRVEAIISLMDDEDSFVVVKASEAMPSAKDRGMIKRLAGIASKKPGIAEKIIESLVPSRYDDDAIDVSKFFLDFLDNEHAEVRRGGLKGLQSAYDSKVDDAILTKTVKDSDEKNRILGMQVFVKRLSSIRPDAPEEEVVIRRAVVEYKEPSLLSRLFGFGSKPKPAVKILPQPAVEAVPKESEKTTEEVLDLLLEENSATEDKGNGETAGETATETKPSVTTETNDDDRNAGPKEESEEPELEQWLAKFVSGEVKDTEFNATSQAIAEALASATSEEEKFAAGVALAAYGQSERIAGLVEAATNEEMKKALAGLLIWVPFEDRVKLVDTIVTPETTEAELNFVLDSFSSVSNPRGAAVFWKLTEHPNVDLGEVYRSFYQLMFDGSENYYDLSPIKKRNEKYAAQFVASVPADEKLGDNGALLALALLNHFDQPKAKQLATKFLGSDRSEEVKHLAARVLLRTEKYITSQWGDRTASTDRSHAVEVLKSTNPVQVTLAMKYIAFGENVLNADQEGEENFRIAEHNYYGSSPGRKEGTAKLFNPPKGMAETMLDFKGVQLDGEGKAYACYFRSLFDEKTDLKDLIDYYKRHPEDSQTNKLVCRSVAATNNDDLVGMVEKIFEFNVKEDNGDRELADLYWTIRPMDGDNALKLRKLIRDKVGSSRLNQY